MPSMQPHGEIPEFRRRYRYLVAFVIMTFLVLGGRLWQLQVVHGERYAKATEDNFIQEVRIPTVRGVVFDRQRRPLITNRPSYDVYVTPRFVTPASIDKLAELLALDPDRASALRARIKSVRGRGIYARRLLLRDISRDQLARLETHKSDISGISVLAMAHRNYLHGNLAAHVLGYMNEVRRSELRDQRLRRVYTSGDLVGRAGVERMYEQHLRGVMGRERIVVDAKGRRKGNAIAKELLKGAPRVEPLPGHNLVLTIDLDLQRLVERALSRYPSGAAVVLEVNTGRLLASASRPSFDPNMLTGRLSTADARRLLQNPRRPLLDKVFRENYFPGSTYKVITAIAALEEGIVTGDETVNCKRWYRFGGRNFRCGHAHGNVNLHFALAESCNIFFYTLAERVGMDTIARYARLLGLGASTGLGLNGEVDGFIPTKAWYRRQRRPFRLGFTLNAAIGQGNTKTTPIQIAALYATIANGGNVYLPQIVERIESSNGQTVQAFEPRIRRRLNLKSETLTRVKQALYAVVQDRKGTAYDARIEGLSVSGKTGTAQVSRRMKRGKTVWLGDHSWFAAFAPSEAPEIAVAVLIEHGGRAAKVAAPVAMRIIRGYFKYVSRRGAERSGPRAAVGQRGEQP